MRYAEFERVEPLNFLIEHHSLSVEVTIYLHLPACLSFSEYRYTISPGVVSVVGWGGLPNAFDLALEMLLSVERECFAVMRFLSFTGICELVNWSR